jgi:allantoin racemase
MQHMQKRLLHSLGVDDRPHGLSVADVEGGTDTFEWMAEIGRQLRDEDGADTIIMGRAGMARYRIPREDTLGLPVIKPTQAAASIAIGTLAVAAR